MVLTKKSAPNQLWKAVSNFDISKNSEEEEDEQALLPGSVRPRSTFWRSNLELNEPMTKLFVRRQSSSGKDASKTTGLPPKSRRFSVNSLSNRRDSLKEDIKKLWARRPSLNLFRSSSSISLKTSNNRGSVSNIREETVEDSDSDVSSGEEEPPFLIVDRSLLIQKTQERRKSTFSIFRSNN